VPFGLLRESPSVTTTTTLSPTTSSSLPTDETS
jgi:hypothetical protein